MLRKEKNKNNIELTEPKTGSLFKRRLNYGIGYLLLIAAVLVVFIVVNVLLERLPMSVDLTANKQFSITNETKEILSNLNEDVEIVALYDRVKGMADTQKAEVIRILDLYDTYSRVKVSYVSLDSNPNIINDTVGQANAAAYSEGDYIVKSGKRSKRIPGNDMFTNSTQYISNIIPVTYATGNQTESRVSTAIAYVTREEIPIVYISTGLQEEQRSAYSKIFEDLDNMNILVKEIDLSQVNEIPQDAGAIVFLSPKRDLSAVEYDMLLQWLSFERGMAFFAFDSDRTGVNFERFNSLLQGLYGLSLNNDIVSDEAAYQIAAAAKSSVITASALKNGPFSVNSLDKSYFSYDSRSINLLSTTGYFESHPLIQTSSTATSTAYGSGTETKGVATLAACGEYYEQGSNKHSRIVVMGSSLGLTDENIQKYSDTSSELLFLYSIDWMLGENTMESLSIEAKQYSTTVLTVDNTSSKWIFAFSVILYPLAIIAVGIVIWLRRRHL